MRCDRCGTCQHLSTFDFFALDAAQQYADIVARLALIEDFAEHLDAGHDRLRRVAEPHDLDFLADLDLAALDAPCYDSPAPRDRENVFDRHQEWLVGFARRLRHVAVYRLHQIQDGLAVRAIVLAASALERLQRAAANYRDVVTRKFIFLQQVAHFQLDQIQQFRIIDHVDLVHEDHDRGHTALPPQQYMPPCLRHPPFLSADP